MTPTATLNVVFEVEGLLGDRDSFGREFGRLARELRAAADSFIAAMTQATRAPAEHAVEADACVARCEYRLDRAAGAVEDWIKKHSRNIEKRRNRAHQQRRIEQKLRAGYDIFDF